METAQKTKLEFGRKYILDNENYRYLGKNEKESTHTFACFIFERTGIQKVVFRDSDIENVDGKQLKLNDCGYHSLFFFDSTDEKMRNEYSRLDKLLRGIEK